MLSRQNLASALTGTEDSTLFVDEDRAAETQASLAQVPTVALRTIKEVGARDLTADAFLADSSVATKGTTDILVFTVTNHAPLLAGRLASAYARQYTIYRGELDSAAIVRARDEVQTKLDQLRKGGQVNTSLYSSLENKVQLLATLQTLQTARASVIRTADAATKVQPKPFRNGVLGLVLGLVLGVGLAFGRDAVDTRVRDPHEIGEQLGLVQLARLPAPPRKLQKANGLVMLGQPAGVQAEAVRMLRTNLDFVLIARESSNALLIVTSAVEEEGKSTTAANLAIAMARAGRRIALVDLDLRRPFIHHFFGLQESAGITDVTLGRLRLEEALWQIDLSGRAPLQRVAIATQAESNGTADHGALYVLTAGSLPPDPGEFVGTQRLARILSTLREEFDTVILDTPPSLRVGDAMTLSRVADGIIIVTRLNIVRRGMLTGLRRLLDAAPAAKLGYVVTAAEQDSGEDYGYGYGYGYGATERSESAADPVKERA